jgi:methionyl-tRNA formyltransferase
MNIAVLMAGGNIFGRMILEALNHHDISPVLVINEINTPRAKTLETWQVNGFYAPPKIEDLSNILGGRYETVDHFHGEKSKHLLQTADLDYVINGGCGILKPDFLTIPSQGFLNIHPGLLPEFRGLDPVLWSLYENGTVGATLHFLSKGIDEGDLLIRRAFNWDMLKDVSVIGLRLSCMLFGVGLLVEFLKNPSKYPREPQNNLNGKYYSKFPEEKMADIEVKLLDKYKQEK